MLHAASKNIHIYIYINICFFCFFYLRFSHCKDELLRAFLPDAGLPLLAGDHHEVVATATKSDDRLVGVREQRIL